MYPLTYRHVYNRRVSMGDSGCEPQSEIDRDRLQERRKTKSYLSKAGTARKDVKLDQLAGRQAVGSGVVKSNPNVVLPITVSFTGSAWALSTEPIATRTNIDRVTAVLGK